MNNKKYTYLDAGSLKSFLFHNQEKKWSAISLIINKKDLVFQNDAKIKKEEQLLEANKELIFQNEEKEKRALELIIANKELVYQNSEKEKRALELIIANKELVYQNSEKEKRASELIIANKELVYQNAEKEKRAIELVTANKKLKKTEADLKEYIDGLKTMMFMTSHKVRQPVAHILGLSNLLESDISEAECKKLFTYIKQSANSLDVFTKELTVLMNELEQKNKILPLNDCL